MGVVACIILIWFLAHLYRSSQRSVPKNKRILDTPAPINRKKESNHVLTYQERKDLNREVDEFLGGLDIELPVRKNKYRPRPDLVWFDSNFGVTLQPSCAEQKIIDELTKYNIKWAREISFAGLRLTTGGWARYDFYLHEYNTIIEYNSRQYHLIPGRAEVDMIKEQFCKDQAINLVTLTHRDYYHIPVRVKELMDKIGILSHLPI